MLKLQSRKRDKTFPNFFHSEIKKKFPRLVKLVSLTLVFLLALFIYYLYSQDGAELGPTIGFDVADDATSSIQLPSWKGLFLCNPAGSELVSKFLEQYFMLFDSDNRQALLEAYHEHAMFSITATNNQHYTPEEK
jgi:nuclear RNA export factor